MEVEVEAAVAAVAARHLQLHKVGEDGLDPRLRAVDREDAHCVARDDVAVRHLPLQVERHRGARAAGVRAQAPDNPKVAREVERRVGGLEQQHVAPHLRRERERQRRRRRRLRLRLRFGLLPVCRAALALAFALERDGRARLRGEVARQRRLLRRVLGDPLGLGGVVVGHRLAQFCWISSTRDEAISSTRTVCSSSPRSRSSWTATHAQCVRLSPPTRPPPPICSTTLTNLRAALHAQCVRLKPAHTPATTTHLLKFARRAPQSGRASTSTAAR